MMQHSQHNESDLHYQVGPIRRPFIKNLYKWNNYLFIFLIFSIFKFNASVPFQDDFKNKLMIATTSSLLTDPSKRSIRKIHSSNNTETDMYIMIWWENKLKEFLFKGGSLRAYFCVFRTVSISSNTPTD